MQPKGFIFDMNGTIIDDMPWHTKIWNQMINELGAGHSLEQTKEELYGKNSEILERIFPGRFTDAEKDALEMDKEKLYQRLYKSEMKLIDGLDIFFEKAAVNNTAVGLGTAAIKFNVDFILDGLNIRQYFKSIVTAENVTISKPHPETFLKCAAEMNVNPENCIVFEDSPKGVETALNAGMKCVALTTMHTAEEFEKYSNIICVVKDYTDNQLKQFFP
jgi:beta-phosphoglucomutase family hydrolase